MTPRLPNMRTSLRRLFASRRRPRLRTNSEAFRYLNDLATANFPDGPPQPFDSRTDERLARAIAADAIYVVTEFPGRSSQDWYGQAIEGMVTALALSQPELIHDVACEPHESVGIHCADDARCVLMACLAITSQNVTVRTNARLALDQYRHFLSCGELFPVSVGKNGASIEANIHRFNHILAMSPGNIGEIRRLFATPFSAGEFQKTMESWGLRSSLRELKTERVFGSNILGPKIGSFYQNLMGNPDSLTIDMWLMRTWGRLTGRLMQESVSIQASDRLLRSVEDFVDGEPELAAKLFSEDLITRMKEPATLPGCAMALARVWNNWRKTQVANGVEAGPLAETKRVWDWPNAAQAVMTAASAPLDSPANATERAWIRSVMKRSLEVLEEAGYVFSLAELQATLWYPEKTLTSFITERPDPAINMSFDVAFMTILSEEGFEFPTQENDEQKVLEPCGRATPG